MDIHFFPAQFVANNLVSPLNCVGIFFKIQLTMDVRDYFWTLCYVDLNCMYILMAVPHQLRYYSFTGNLALISPDNVSDLLSLLIIRFP